MMTGLGMKDNETNDKENVRGLGLGFVSRLTFIQDLIP